MMTKRSLIFIRHGETNANATGLLLGRHDAPLNDRGHAQARAVANAVINPERFGVINNVITSPLLRAHQTAEMIAEQVQTHHQGATDAPTLSIDERFIELDYGVYDGQPIQSIDDATWRKWRTDPTFTPPGGESLQTLHNRVGTACDDLINAPTQNDEADVETPSHESIVVVTHVSPLKAAVTWGLDVPSSVTWRTFVGNATITVISQHLGRLALVTFNEAAHLDGL